MQTRFNETSPAMMERWTTTFVIQVQALQLAVLNHVQGGFMNCLRSVSLIVVLIASAGMAQNPAGQPVKAGPHQNMAGMHDEMMKGMQADLDSMRANLQKMKDQLSKVSDASTKDQLQLNISMWQTMIDNMDKHMSMMKGMMGGHDTMGGHDMMMHGGQTPTPKK